MPKTSKITFNVNDLQRQHTGQKRRYDNVGLARLINSPTTQERIAKGDLLGFYGHWPRKKFGMQPKEGGMDGGKPITLKPAIRTTFLEADNNGNLTHQTEFLDTQEGKDAYDLYQNKVGGFSAAMTTVPKGGTLRLLPNAASNVAILYYFNVNVDVRFTFISDTGTTYTVPASSVTAAGKTIIELSNNSLTNITVATTTATGKNVGDSVNISITGTYNAQVLVAGAGVVLEGDLVFYYQYQTKTLILKNTSTNTWKVVG